MTFKKGEFDPFSYQNLFYEYQLEITDSEINQVLFLVKEIHNSVQNTTYDHLNVLNFPILKNLKKQIISILDNHKLSLRNNWAQLYNDGDSHGIHNHPSSIYSGIIYLKGNNPSPTIFYNNIFGSYVYKFKKNTLLLFPSHIPHEVKKLNKDEDRLIISFNTWKGS
jgi:hypothetical protein|tara:strand:+ start:531 stop:1028 length:498 start_codon:yes stop_codon:yes gene_type:complete